MNKALIRRLETLEEKWMDQMVQDGRVNIQLFWIDRETGIETLAAESRVSEEPGKCKL